MKMAYASRITGSQPGTPLFTKCVYTLAQILSVLLVHMEGSGHIGYRFGLTS